LEINHKDGHTKSRKKVLCLNDINLRIWQSTRNARYGVMTIEFSARLAEGRVAV
jgi:hypothetical protein